MTGSAVSETFNEIRGMSHCGRTSPYASVQGDGYVPAGNGKLLFKPGYSGLIPNKNYLTGLSRPFPALIIGVNKLHCECEYYRDAYARTR